MKKIQNAIVAPKGFKANAVHSGIKRRRYDLSLIYSETACAGAAVYTRNIVKAAPLLVTKEIIEKNSDLRAVVINSGNANACTGKQGLEDAKSMVKEVECALGLPADSVLVASTGVIGVPLPMDRIKKGITEVVKNLEATQEAAGRAVDGIMTTDLRKKGVAYEFELNGKTVKIGAIAKGSGMIHPNMGTMLGFITTDCAISNEMLQKALSETTENTYNMLSVDGDTSTNDMVVLLANGLADNNEINCENEDYIKFKEVLEKINVYLAKQIVMDGEGATKFLEAEVIGGKTPEDAKKLAKTIISSTLVKTAFFGEDANWGRVLAAMGRSGGEFSPEKVKIEFIAGKNDKWEDPKPILLMENGTPVPFEEEHAREVLERKFIKIKITLEDGDATATAWGCDLSYEYVRINGEYRT
ncbi:MAG: bifunctional ornithine acetyltransferase/N-acetylglutamate synthase [Synergistaceae bacterium]|jgi:glutamate N-acetyltransferase/amino-acid N-acetyltransferase|nr:bifunctional ornithine acetyltransferase/N-acetylglutamate synthase [Synergistaceae bacterium]